ncbi:MAG: tyrosine-type recombinase/integrase [Candidatus Woesearchaeota archaeon]
MRFDSREKDRASTISDSPENLRKISKEIEDLISSVSDQRDFLILELLWKLGLNANELVNLKISDISFSEKTLEIRAENTKNKQARTLILDEKLLHELRSYVEKNNVSGFLFSTRQSPRFSVRRLEQIVGNYFLSGNARLTPRLLRKIFIEKSLSDGKDKEEIARKAGIKDIAKKNYLTEDEYKKLISNIYEKKHILLTEILWRTGITVNELVNLKKSDFSFSQNILIIRPEITKSGLPRAIILPEKLSQDIKSYTKDFPLRSFIFSSQKSQQISPLRVRQILSYYSEKSGLETIATPQVLRNSHIANAHTNGESLSSIGERLGIKQMNTNTYASLLYPEERRARGT